MPSLKTIAFLCLAAVSGLQAQDHQLTAPEKAQIATIAKTDLQVKLAETIKGVHISANATVRDSVDLKSTQNSFVDAILRGVEISQPVFQDDYCIVSGKITLATIVENVEKLLKENNGKVVETLEKAAKYNGDTYVVKAQGLGSIRSQDSRKAAKDNDDNGMRAAMAALKGPGQEKINAIRVSEIDAYANLAAAIKGLHISDQTTVDNGALSRFTESATKALVQGARVVAYAAEGEDLVYCHMEIALADVVENISKTSTQFSDGRTVSQESIKRYNDGISIVKAYGIGAVNTGRSPRAASPRIGSVQ